MSFWWWASHLQSSSYLSVWPILLVHLPYKWSTCCSTLFGRLHAQEKSYQLHLKCWALYPDRLIRELWGSSITMQKQFIIWKMRRRDCQSGAHKTDVHLADHSTAELSLQKMKTQKGSHPTLTKAAPALIPCSPAGKSCFFPLNYVSF